jgi:hypothetical protein
MPPYLLYLEGWKALWPIPLAAMLLTAILVAIARPKSEQKEFIVVIAAFTMLGIIVGYLTAFSRQSAIGAVLPAVLSLMGALAVFLVGKDKSSRLVVGLSVLAFSLSLLLGTTWGSVMRSIAEEYKSSEVYLKQQAFIESQVRDFRESLDVPVQDEN